MDLDKDLVDAIKGLKLVFTDKPQPDLLIKIPNKNRDVDYKVIIVTDEFTSLCPLNPSQPDYAKIDISYVPNEWLIELKSLKFYLVSFRMVETFHEEVPATILRDLVALLSPKVIIVTGYFTIRGGIKTKVKAEYVKCGK